MIHNFVITRPGARLKVVAAALELGADGPGRNFVPALLDVLWSTPALNPGQSAVLRFNAPSEEGVYPYVCTFPGHGFAMFGAMYVTRGPLPPLAADRNIPPEAAVAAGKPRPGDGLLVVKDRPVISRTFLPDCGPAAIAVGMPGGQSYCFDAALCQLRYAWRGAFLDNTDQWRSKGDMWSQVLGRIYYRAPDQPWLRLGRPDHLPVVRWRGYRLRSGSPEFDFELDGHPVREWVQPRPAGDGLEITYSLASLDVALYLKVDPAGGAAFSASAGNWTDGTLQLRPSEAARFMIDLVERPKVEPLRYWSMNDTLWRSADVDPPPGVIGRGFAPGGEEEKRRTLWSGVEASDLRDGATLACWVRLRGDAAFTQAQPLFAAAGAILLAPPWRDRAWHHLAGVYPSGSGPGRLYVDGVEEKDGLAPLPPSFADLEIGSVGGRYLDGTLDEVRIYDRALDAGAVARLYRQEAEKGKLSPP